MNKIDEIILAAGTTGKEQCWFTRPEVKKVIDMVIRECVTVCHSADHNDCFTGHEFGHIAEEILKRFGK